MELERLNEIQGLCGAGLDHATGEFVAWDEALDLIAKWDFPDCRNQPMDFRT